MPSHGSLQQAVKVRPGRGKGGRIERERERKKKSLPRFVKLFLLRHELRNISPQCQGYRVEFVFTIWHDCQSVIQSKLQSKTKCTKYVDGERVVHEKTSSMKMFFGVWSQRFRAACMISTLAEINTCKELKSHL